MKCITKNCNNERAHQRRKCWKCIKRKYRDDNKTKAAYQNLRTIARAKGENFNLSYEEFESTLANK